jgi:hypothetical protein
MLPCPTMKLQLSMRLIALSGGDAACCACCQCGLLRLLPSVGEEKGDAALPNQQSQFCACSKHST